MPNERENRPRLPPRWFVRLAWDTHRGLYRATGGRVGLWRPRRNGWWFNLQTHTGARVDLADRPCIVRARAAEGEERSRLWARWREVVKNLDAYASLRSSETAVVILEPGPRG